MAASSACLGVPRPFVVTLKSSLKLSQNFQSCPPLKLNQMLVYDDDSDDEWGQVCDIHWKNLRGIVEWIRPRLLLPQSPLQI